MGALLLGAALCAVGALLLLIAAYWPRTYYWPPEPTVLSTDYRTAEPLETQLAVLDTITSTYTLNEEHLAVKLLLTKVALVLAPLAGLLALVTTRLEGGG